jgi:hypothetical protein
MNIDLSTEAGQETAKEYIKETLERNTNTNTITDSEKENIHEQNTDTKLDEGGANEVSAIELKALLETLDGGEIT